MADPHQDSEQVDTTEVHNVSNNIIILNSENIGSDLKGDMLDQHLDDGNIHSTQITYVVPPSEQSESPTVTDSVPGSISGTGVMELKSISLEELNLQSGDETIGVKADLQNSGHTSVAQINGSENVNNSDHLILPDSHPQQTDSDAITSKSEISNGQISPSSNKFISMSHHMSPQTISFYSTSNQLSDDNSSTHIIQQTAVGAAAIATDSQNHTTIQFSKSNGNEPSQIVDVKSQLKLHPIPSSPTQTVQIAAPRGISMTPEILQSVIQQVKAQQLSQLSSQQPSSQGVPEGDADPQNNGVSFTLVSPNQQNPSVAPLGSSQNPIRIIQQGNRYTPMQQLTSEQLQQIMQVVQQQHTSNATKAQENGGTVIFNPHTNTKIMYRVIYPSELHKSQASSGQTTYQVLKPVTLSQEQQTTSATPVQKRPYRRRKEIPSQLSGIVVNGEEDKERGSGDAPELSKEEKEERKKHRPRTRSGRVSKPPKHMVQDYKHIHVLDWDEDYDDSDGGYSDLKQSDEESKSRQNDEGEQEASPDLFQALGAGKPKNYKCHTCEKSYIGQAGLERHYRLAPEHRRSEDSGVENSHVHDSLMADGEDSSKEASITQDGNSRNSDPGPFISKSNGLVDNFSEDSNTQDSVNSIGTSSPIIRRGRGRGSYRGRWAHLKHNAHAKRKNKLREFTKMCSDEDLMEVLFPRLVGCISTWEFLLMKAEKGGSRPKVDIIYKEFEDLLRPLKRVCAGYMKPVNESEVGNLHTFDKVIKVHDENLASCLGLNVGMYKVEEMLPDDSNSFSSLHNKLSAASISLSNNSSTQERNETFLPVSGKRKYELTSPSKLDNIPIKKQCLMTSSSSNISTEQSLISLNGLQSNSNENSIPQITSSTHLPSPFSHSLESSVSQNPNLIKVETSSPSSQSHPSLSYFISASNGKGIATSQALKSQLVPVVLNSGSNTSNVAVSSSQILPVVLNSQSSRTTVSPSATGTKTGQISSLPLLLAAPGNQLQGSTIFLASGNQATSQNVLVKQPSSQTKQQSTFQQHQKHKNVSSHHHSTSPISKSQISLLGAINKTHANVSAKVGVSSASSLVQRFDVNTKPAEVKVSRKLFHEATSSSSPSLITTSSSLSSLPSSTYVTSGGHPNNTVLVTSPHKMKTNFNDSSSSISSLHPSLPLSATSSQIDNNSNQLQSVSTTCSSSGNMKRELENNVLNYNTLEFSNGAAEGPIISTVSSHTTTPVSDLNRGVTAGHDEDLDSSFDISAGVLSSIGFSGDDLSSLNTSSDNPPSIPVSLPNLGVNQVSSVINEIIAPSSNDISNGVSLIQPPKAASGNDSSMCHVNTTDSPFINGSTPEFPAISPPSLKLKGNIILPGPQSTSSSFISSSEFIHLISNRPSSPLMSSPCKDSSLNNSTTSVSFNLTSMDNSLQSQILKSEATPSAIMDLGGLSFTDQSDEQQINGVSSSLNSDVDILPEQITQPVEAVNPLLELPQQLVSDDMTISAPAGEEEGQFLLTEGSNIYQTDDGAWFIQSADGNTYQLQGAQGLPMETVQALLSGNLDLNGDVQADESVQTAHVMH